MTTEAARKLPALRVKSVEPAIIYDKAGTITKVLAQQDKLLHRQEQFESLRVDPNLLAGVRDSRRANTKKPSIHPPARENGDQLEHERNTVLTGAAAAAHMSQEEQQTVMRQFPFATKMHVEQVQQCDLIAQEHLARQQEDAADAIEAALPLAEQSKELLWRNRSVWKTLQVVRTVEMASLEGEALRFLVFLVLLLLVMVAAGTVRAAYSVSDGIQETLTLDFYDSIETFETIANYDNFWSWVKLGLLPATYTSDNLLAGSNLVFGAVRFRQQRVRADSCTAPSSFNVDSAVNPCYAGNVDSDTRDTAAFGPSGRYTWTSSGLSIVHSRFETFGDNGYVTDLPLSYTLAEATAQVDTMIADSWLSSPTRLVVVEMTAVNVNVGLFAYIQMISEFTAGGSVQNIVRVYPVPISNWSSDSDFLATFVILSLWFTMLFIQFSWRVYLYGLNYLRVIWNVLELGTHITFFAFFGYAWAYFVAHRDMSLDVSQAVFGSGLWEPAGTRITMQEFFSFTLLFALFALYKFLRLEPRMAVLLDSVTNARKDIFWFVVAWAVTTLGFAVCAHLLFGSHQINYHRLDSSAFTLVRMMLGELDTIADLIGKQFYVANIYFIIFAIFVTIILLNLFIGIVSEYFSKEHDRHTLMEAESRRRGCLLPQFEYHMFQLLFVSWINILTDPDSSLCTRIRVFLLNVMGISSLSGNQTGACRSCRYLNHNRHKMRERDATVQEALALFDLIGISVSNILWEYLELSISQEQSGQAVFLKDGLEHFKQRLERDGVTDPQQAKLSETASFLPDSVCIPELAYIIQYQLMHPDLRPGTVRASDHRAADLEVFGCRLLNSHVSKEDVEMHKFGSIYVQIALLLAHATDLQLEIESAASSHIVLDPSTPQKMDIDAPPPGDPPVLPVSETPEKFDVAPDRNEKS